jgi:DNA replication protein DnaC
MTGNGSPKPGADVDVSYGARLRPAGFAPDHPLAATEAAAFATDAPLAAREAGAFATDARLATADAAAFAPVTAQRALRGVDDPCPYELCDGSGFLYDESTNTAFDCRCRPQRIALAKARSLSAVIPRRYRDVAFDRSPVTEIEPRRVVDAVRSFVDRIDEHLDAGRGLWFMGPVGTGKTSLAMLVSKAALKAGRSVAIFSLPRLLNEIRDTHRAERSHGELLDRLTAVDLLHIDDVGAERTTDWVLEELYSIVNARYEDRRSMVITTNILDHDALCAQITQRTVSRLIEMCTDVHLDGHDRRMDPRSG